MDGVFGLQRAGSAGVFGFQYFAGQGESESSGGGASSQLRMQAPVIDGAIYTREQYLQWVVQTVAMVAATGALDG